MLEIKVNKDDIKSNITIEEALTIWTQGEGKVFYVDMNDRNIYQLSDITHNTGDIASEITALLESPYKIAILYASK